MACTCIHPRGWLAGFIKDLSLFLVIKRITQHCYTQNIKTLGLIISEKIHAFTVVCIWELLSLVWYDWQVLCRTPDNIAAYWNIQVLGLVVSEKAPGCGQFCTTGAWLEGFIKAASNHCYTQNIKALAFGVSEKKIFILAELFFVL